MAGPSHPEPACPAASHNPQSRRRKSRGFRGGRDAHRPINKPDFRVASHWPAEGRRLQRRLSLAGKAVCLLREPRRKKGTKHASIAATVRVPGNVWGPERRSGSSPSSCRSNTRGRVSTPRPAERPLPLPRRRGLVFTPTHTPPQTHPRTPPRDGGTAATRGSREGTEGGGQAPGGESRRERGPLLPRSAPS